MIKSSLVFLMLVCASAASGGALQQFLLSSSSREIATGISLDEGAVRQLSGITDERRAIRSRLDAPAAEPSLTREAVMPGGMTSSSISELTSAMERLKAVIDSVNVKLISASTALHVTRKTISPAEIVELAKSLKDLPEVDVRRKFMFLPTQELLHRFGPPTRIAFHSGSISWIYASSETIVDGENWGEVLFRIADGCIFDADVSFNE